MKGSERENLIRATFEYFIDPVKTKKLLKKADDFFLLKSFKIREISTKGIIEAYQRLRSRYQTAKDHQILAHGWHKNERKIFIWLLICYCESHETDIYNMTKNQWKILGDAFFQKSPKFLEFQGFSLIKNSRRFNWKEEDDQQLQKKINKYGPTEWNEISKQIFFESQQSKFISPKQCRQRWFNHLNKKVNKETWSSDEDVKILQLSLRQGKKWAKIAKLLDTNRTQHMIKNRYNSIVHSITKSKKTQQEYEIVEREIKKRKQNNERDYSSQQKQIKNEVRNKKGGIQKSEQLEEQVDESLNNKNIKLEESQLVDEQNLDIKGGQFFKQSDNFTQIISMMAQNNSNGCLTFKNNDFNSPFPFLNLSQLGDRSSHFPQTPSYKAISPMDPSFFASSAYFKNGLGHENFPHFNNTSTTPQPGNSFNRSFTQNSQFFLSGFNHSLTPLLMKSGDYKNSFTQLSVQDFLKCNEEKNSEKQQQQ